MKESPELRLGNLAAYGAACLGFMTLFYGFSPLNTVVALTTALLLSIQLEDRYRERRFGIIAGAIVGILPLCLWLLEWKESSLVMYGLAGVASTIYIASHWGKEKLQPISTLFYFIVTASFVGSFGGSIAKYAELIFFTIAVSVSAPLLFVRINKKMRIHRRAHIRRQSRGNGVLNL